MAQHEPLHKNIIARFDQVSKIFLTPPTNGIECLVRGANSGIFRLPSGDRHVLPRLHPLRAGDDGVQAVPPLRLQLSRRGLRSLLLRQVHARRRAPAVPCRSCTCHPSGINAPTARRFIRSRRDSGGLGCSVPIALQPGRKGPARHSYGEMRGFVLDAHLRW